MRLAIRRTSQFKKDAKRLIQSGKDIEKLLFVVNELAEGRKLGPNYHDHSLKGGCKGKRDCHVEPDWILLYAIEDNELVLYRTGNHAHLFG
ncbi:MAG: type II toxin-antitoxin system YafQ family toxin [Deltaproteobacteria bacterium]|nr:type II toxin-antitoxin system YafQ family toxin [Deltaproteobacteria bacterium]